jgi:CHAT domain-containing protein
MRRRWILGVALATLTTFAVLLVWRDRFLSPRDPRLRTLIAAAADLNERPFEVRLSGGFPYRPLAPTLRGPDSDEPKPSRWKGFAAAAELQEEALKLPSGDTLHAFGLSQLFLRRPSAAVETLESALFRETQQNEITVAIAKSSDAVLLSDLAAAYSLRSQTAHHARDLMASAECAARARRIDPQNSEAAWNRAIAFEAIGVTDVARTAWSDFLALDSESEWAVEARRHLRTLTAPPLAQRWESDRQQLLDAAGARRMETVNVLVQRYPEQARTLVEEDLLGEWAEARQAGKGQEASDALVRARAIAEAVGNISHDFLARDATAAVTRNAPGTLPFLIRGHRAYLAARQLYKSGQHPQAEPMLVAAMSDFERGGSPLAFRAGAYDITSKNYLGRPSDAMAMGRSLLQQLGSDAVSYPTVAGQTHWARGLAAMATGSLDEALSDHRAALAAFQHTEETSNLAGVVQVISADYRAIGDLDNAWIYQIQSFRLASQYASFERAQVVVGGGAATAIRDGYVTVADELQGGVLARARSARQPIFLCSALLASSRTFMAVGAVREASAAITEALREWGAIPETAMKNVLRADLEVARATLPSGLTPRDRVAELSTAMEFIQKTSSRSRVANVLLLRARAHRDAGDEKSAENDLVAGIAEVEAQREKTASDERLTFLNTAVDLYDEAMRMRLRHGDEAGAFDILERRRARWLLDRFAGIGRKSTASVDTGENLRRQIPAGVVVISYVFSNRVDAWALSSSSLKHLILPRSADEIAANIAGWRDSMNSPISKFHRQFASVLYDSLIQPLRQEIGSAQALIIVPDRILNAVSFSGLLDPNSGRYLIEDFGVTIAPSANLYVRCLTRSRLLKAGRSSLIVANPAIAEDDSLAPLGGADAEGAAIAAMLPEATVLTSTDATVERFKSAAAEAGLIHFAGHAMINPLHPELSSLVLAPAREGGASRLFARDIFQMHLPHTRLVVLAACNSASGRTDSDAPLSLATSFIAAGTPATIASLWSVDDVSSSEFFRRVYQNMRSGMSAANALRAAQISFIRSANATDATWAAYQLVGGIGM